MLLFPVPVNCLCSHLLLDTLETAVNVTYMYVLHAFCVLQMSFLTDVRQVLHVFWLFIPLPVFWALYDQQVCSVTYQFKLLQDSFALHYQDVIY